MSKLIEKILEQWIRWGYEFFKHLMIQKSYRPNQPLADLVNDVLILLSQVVKHPELPLEYRENAEIEESNPLRAGDAMISMLILKWWMTNFVSKNELQEFFIQAIKSKLPTVEEDGYRRIAFFMGTHIPNTTLTQQQKEVIISQANIFFNNL